MRRIVLVVGVVLLFIGGVQGQKISDSIFYKKIAGEYMFIQNDQAVCPSQALFLMHESPDAMKFINRSRGQWVISGGLQIISGILLAYGGWELLSTDERITTPVMLGGVLLFTIGAFMRDRIPKNIGRAVDVYNNELTLREYEKVGLDFGLNPNGLGFSFKF